VIRNLRFLTSRVDLAGARHGLLVQTGSPDLLARTVDVIRSRLPELELSVLRQRGARDRILLRGDVHYLDNEGSKLELVRALRARNFDVVFVLFSNEPGYWKLKLLPYLLAADGLLAVNEHLGWFPLTIQRAGELTHHLRWRLKNSVTVAPGGVAPLLASVGKAVTYPGVLAYLLGYERLKSSRLGADREKLSWKRPAPS
jgi:hypothetical protein